MITESPLQLGIFLDFSAPLRFVSHFCWCQFFTSMAYRREYRVDIFFGKC